MQQPKVSRYLFTYYSNSFPRNIYLLKVINKNKRKSVVYVKGRHSGIFIVKFEDNFHNFFLVFLSLTSSIYLLAGSFMLRV